MAGSSILQWVSGTIRGLCFGFGAEGSVSVYLDSSRTPLIYPFFLSARVSLPKLAFRSRGFFLVGRIEFALDGERRGRAVLSSVGLGVVLVDLLLNRCRVQVRQIPSRRGLLLLVGACCCAT